MQCLNCGFENPAGMKFCGECGSPLKHACPDCGFENPLNFKFCGQCGASLTGRSAPALRPQAAPELPADDVGQAERRHLTVMFGDLVGSTLLSHQLDPEELRRVIRAYQEVCGAVIGRFEGHVAQYLGDGLLVYFGYPLAHEDDAQRAVRTGLAILEAIERLNHRLEQEMGLSLNLRLGIHTGLAVVGRMGNDIRHEPLALGETPNIAARLQNLAEPNSVVISAATYRLVQDYFDCQLLGTRTLKGVAQPLTLYRVVRERGIRSRLEATVAAGLTPLVGRSQELALLSARWEQVKEGRGQVVLLNGEAGIGKSRLVRVFKEHLAGEPYTWLECHGSAYHQNSALYPITDLLQQILAFDRTDTVPEKLGKLEAILTGWSPRTSQADRLSEAVPLLAALLGVPLGEEYAPVTLSPQRQKQRTLEIVLALLLEMADQRPVVFTVEDLHWIDPSTLELLTLLIEQSSTVPILALFTSRPSFSPTWAARSHLTQLTLNRLTQPQVEAMISQVTAGKAIPAELLDQIIVKTDGVPLFVEELTKMVLEQGWLVEAADHYELPGSLPALAIPSTLHDSLMARLDRLATVKEVALLAAPLGREFDYELLRAISRLDEPTLRQSLARLVEAELLYQRGVPPHASYMFKHALIQETAYRSLLRSNRQQYHLRIAQVLVEQFLEVTELEPELVAYHYTAAGDNETAVRYWEQAGQRAIEQSANEEAIDHLKKGVALLESLPETPARIERKLALQISLGVPLLMTRGYASLEVERVYARAWQLCQQIGETEQLSSALFGLWVFYLVRADYRMASQLGEALMTLAERQQEPALLREAHQVQGINKFYLGELAAAGEHLAQAIDHYDPDEAGGRTSYSGADQGVASLCHAALALWLQGYPDQARAKAEAALALAEKLRQPFSRAFGLSMAALLHQYRREGDLALERAGAAIACAREQGFELLLGFSTIFKGWALAEQGQVGLGITEIRRGLDGFQATGAELGRLHFLALLAEAYGRDGQIEAGLSLLAEAITAVHERGERFYEAELYRLKGVLTQQKSGLGSGAGAKGESPESCFRQAIEIARQQAAKSLELRAAIDLSRLWAEQGRLPEAQQFLSGIYGWFREGFDTADLQEAKALLEEWP